MIAPSVLSQIVSLAKCDMEELRERWRTLFGSEPPAYGRELLRRRLAYRIQENAFGGLSEARRQQLRAIDATARQAKPQRNKEGIPLMGAVLVREYEGERHEVTVLHDGFEYRGKKWASLSVIARHITGTRWNGPMFFGLRSQRSAP